MKNKKGTHYCNKCKTEIKSITIHKRTKQHQNEGKRTPREGGWETNKTINKYQNNHTDIITQHLNNKVVIINNNTRKSFKSFMNAIWDDKGVKVDYNTGRKTQTWRLNEELTEKKLLLLDPNNEFLILRRPKNNTL